MRRRFRIALALATLCTAAGIAWAAHQTGDGIAYDKGDPLPVQSSASFQYSFDQDVVTSAPVRLVNAQLQLASFGMVPRVVERQRVRRVDYCRCADPAGCTPSLDGSRSPFRRVYASGRSSTSHDSKDGCVRAASPSGDCVGFCFNAFVKSVDRQNWRNAKVDIIERNGTRTQAVVHRTHVSPESRAPAREGMPVRFACFDKLDDVGRVPGFGDCVQMAVPSRKGGSAVARGSREADVLDDPLGDFPLDL